MLALFVGVDLLREYQEALKEAPSLEERLADWRAGAWLAALLVVFGWIAVGLAAVLFNRQLGRAEAVEARLRESEERLALALDGSGNALWDADLRSGEVVMSGVWGLMLGSPHTATRTTVDELAVLVHPRDRERVRQAFRDALKSPAGLYAVEHRVRRPDGNWMWVLSRGKVSERDARGRALRMTGINADIDVRKQAEEVLRRSEESLKQIAHFDALTGVASRALFLDRLAHAVARGRRTKESLAVMYLDVDRFKSINDRLGHAAGDELLKAFAARLTANVRESDTVGRLGGDEFAVLLEGVGVAENALRVADKIVAAMREPVPTGGGAVAVSTSIGIAMHDGEAPPEKLVERADEALYEAKQAGRNTYRLYAPPA